MDILNKIFTDTLTSYLLMADHEIELLLKSPDHGIKERVGTVNDLQIIIYSNDHNPPHFHVKTKDLKINAKFRIDNCKLLTGEISSKNFKKIKVFHSSSKGKIIMEKIWNKKK